MLTSDETKRHVTVHVTFIKIGEINTPKEVFDADILIRSKWREPLLDSAVDEDELSKYWNPQMYIDNTIGEPKTTSSLHLEHSVQGQAYIIERKRFKGTFMEHMELFEFPFDTQDLSVSVTSDRPCHEVQLVEDSEEIHRIFKRSFIDEQEFYLYKYVSSEQKELQKDKADPFVRRSVLTVRCCATRRPWCFVWNHFAITGLIACMAFLTFAVPHLLVQFRLQLTFTLILTNVTLKFVVGQSLPKISYLTYMDRYLMATMVCLSLVCMYHGIQSRISIDDYPDKDYYAIVVIGGMFLLYNLIFWMRLAVVPFKQQRELRHAEVEYSKMVQHQATKQHISKRGGRKHLL